jgi:NADPH:quinone reductase-like Zn-dependent oxidoreductase
MQAITYSKYGPPSVLKLSEIAKPVPKEDEVLVRIRAAAINSRDWRMLRANPFFIRFMAGGLLGPTVPILGADLAGVVEAVGSKVSQFKPGDEVFGALDRYGGRTFAEYACAVETELALKPANMSFEQAAAVPVAALTALQGLREDGQLKAGQKVLIQGASGGVGTFAVQIAKALGAEVTAVCSSRNLEMVRSLGADAVIDYTKEDFTRSGNLYDLILAVNGYHPLRDYLRALRPEGHYVVAGGSMRQIFAAMPAKNRKSGPTIRVVSQVVKQESLLFIKVLLEGGKVTPVIDGCYPLEKTAEAMGYFEKDHARGKVVITMAQNS